MKFSLILLFTILTSFGCVFQNGKVIVSGNRKSAAKSTISRASVSSVQIINHQLVIHGAGLTDVTNVKVDGNSLAQNFSIESKSATQIIANSIHAFSFDVSKVFNLILSDANAAATFAIDFSLCNSTLNGRGFDCAIAANDRDVLSYDAVSQTWKPRNVNGLNFTGVLPVNGIILETFLQSNVPTSSAVNGDYYIVSGAGGFLRPASGAADLAVSNGDWLSYSDSNTWQVVKNGKNGVASFKGRIGAVVPNSGDYSLHMLSDVDDSSKNDKYVLTYTTTGTPRWIASPILPASTVNATSIVTGTVTGGTGTGNLAANTVTGGGATGNIKQDTITNTEINSAAAIDLSKLGNLPASFVGVPVTTQTNLSTGNTIQQAFQQLALIPQDYVSKSTSVANQLLNGKYDFTGASYLHASTPLAPYVGTTEVATTAYVINYAATLGQWILGGAGAIGYTAGNVGIGTTAPGDPFDVYSTTTNASQTGAVIQNSKVASANGTYNTLGLNIKSQIQVASGVTDSGYYIGLNSNALRNYNIANDQGTLASLVAGSINYGHSNSDASIPVTTNATGLSITAQAKTGSITNMYDLFMSTTQTGGTITNHYGIYQADAAAKNFFAGNVGIGTTAPGALLDVSSNTTTPIVQIYGPTTNTFPPYLMLKAARTAGAAYPQVNDYLGIIGFRNQNNSQSAAIYSQATEAQSATAAGGNLVFNTTANTTTLQVERMRIDQNGNVGIGTTAPAAALDVQGQVRVRTKDNTSLTTIDWNNGNMQYTTDSCQAYTFNNILDGGSYTWTVKGATSAQCTFTGTGLTFHYNPTNAATNASTHTVYTFIRQGPDVYVSWVTGL